MDPSSYSTFTTTEIANTVDASHSWLYYLIPVLVMSLFTFVIDFYIESYVNQKTEPVYASKFGAIFIFTSSLGLSFVWNHPHLVKVMVMDKIKTIIEEEHALSKGLLITFILYILGILVFFLIDIITRKRIFN